MLIPVTLKEEKYNTQKSALLTNFHNQNLSITGFSKIGG